MTIVEEEESRRRRPGRLKGFRWLVLTTDVGKRSLVRNLWVYRRLVALAVVLGLMLWFVLTNNERVTIGFPFGLGQFQSTTGLVILLSAMVGSFATALTMTLIWAIRRSRSDRSEGSPAPVGKSPLDDELPPPDYAAKTGEGINRDAPWS